MGCNGKGSGECRVISGLRASVVILLFAILGLGAGKARPQAPSAPSDANTFSFGDQQVGTRSEPQAIHLQNTGITLLVITNIQATANFSETDDCRPSVPVGGHCAIQVTFNPTTNGPLTGTVTVTSNAAGPPYVFKLNGTGLLTAPEVSPSNLNFGDQSVGSTSASQTVTFTNTGALALSITSLNISNGWTHTNNAPDSPQNVRLDGSVGAVAVWLITSILAFSNQAVGTPSAPVTLGLVADQPLDISVTGDNIDDFSLDQNCGNSLAANTACQITLVFTPKAAGARSASVSISDSAANSPQTISLTGTGVIAAASATAQR